MASRGVRFTTASSRGLTADTEPGTPSDTPDNLQDPGVSVSDFASKQASKNARTRADRSTYDLDDLVAGRPEPELDFVLLNVRVPRYVNEALKLQARLDRRTQQDLVTRALAEWLSPELLGRALRKARG
jgi:hypothetical protein